MFFPVSSKPSAMPPSHLSHPSLLPLTQSTASSICLFSALDTAGQSDKDKQDTEFCGSLTECVYCMYADIYTQSSLTSLPLCLPFDKLCIDTVMYSIYFCFKIPKMHQVFIIFIILTPYPNILHIVFSSANQVSGANQCLCLDV